MMISFFPDVNVWVALSDMNHVHNREASTWFDTIPIESIVIFSRFTQLGLLRLLTNLAVMGPSTRTLQQAWGVFDQLLEEPRIVFHQEPSGLERVLRDVTEPFATQPASKWVSDCYLLAWAKQNGSTLVTFDQGFLRLAQKTGCSAISPALGEGAYA